MEKSNIEILKAFAKSTNRSIFYEEIPYPAKGYRSIQRYKSMIYIPNNSEKNIYFVWFSDPYAKIGLPTIYCGAFIPLPLENKTKLNIRNKNIIDRLNVFSKTKSKEIGNIHFDSKVIISGAIDSSMKKFLAQRNIQIQLIKALEIEPFINISFNENNIDFIPEFQDTPYLSILNPINWCTESNEIEKIFREAEKIATLIG